MEIINSVMRVAEAQVKINDGVGKKKGGGEKIMCKSSRAETKIFASIDLFLVYFNGDVIRRSHSTCPRPDAQRPTNVDSHGFISRYLTGKNAPNVGFF